MSNCNVIAQTGSPALLQTLSSLEEDKQKLAIQITAEKESMIENSLDEKEIVAAYKTAQELYQNGTLTQKKQIINLYLKKVTVYKEYLEIMINNVPATFLKPCEINAGLPSENEEQSGIHIYKKWLKIKEVSTLKLEWTPLDVVEARGVEPLSESILTGLSPGAVKF